MSVEEIRAALIETLEAIDGAGSGLSLFEQDGFGDMWAVEGHLDVGHLASVVQGLIERANGGAA